MQTSDIISTISLIVSIVGIPIGYYLGGRNSRNSTYNNAIDELEKLCQKTFNDAMKIEKSTAKNESDYHLMIANHKLLQSKCSQLKSLSNQTKYPREELLDVKKITTDQLFSEDELVQKAAIRNLIYKLVPLTEFYAKKFY